MDSPIDFGLTGELITAAAPDVDRAMAAVNAGVGAIEVGRGSILFCAADTDGVGAADVGRGGRLACTAETAGVGAADCGRGGRFVEAVCCCGASLPTTG